MTAEPPPGKVAISLALDGFSLSARGVIKSPGFEDRQIIVALRPDGDHLDGMLADAISGQSIHGIEGVRELIERWVADVTGWLIDATTDADDFHIKFLEATGPELAPERIKPLSPPKKAVH